MTDDDLWLPTPTVMDATRNTVRGCWRPGENWRGVSLNNAIVDAGEVIVAGTHTTDMGINELNCMDSPHRDVERLRAERGAGYRNLRDDIDCLPTPTSNEWNGGTIEPARKKAMGHAVSVADYAEKSDDITCRPVLRASAGGDGDGSGGDIRLLAMPDCMDVIAPRDGAALERATARRPGRGLRDSTGNPREDVMMEDMEMMPTPTSRDGKGRNQRNGEDCMPGAVEQGMEIVSACDRETRNDMTGDVRAATRGTPRRACPAPSNRGTRAIPAPGPYHGGLWGLDDGRGVRFGRFANAVRRWERVSGRPAPCPTQATGGLRRWVGAHAADPSLFDPYWLARHAPWDAHPKARLDQPMRDRTLARWRDADRGRSLIDPMFWPGCKDMDPDIPIPATRLPDKSVLDYWKTRSVGSRFPSAAHLSPRFVEWMMGLEDGWVTNPAIWRHVDGNHRNLQLRALGNGVVPPQAAMAIDWALRVRERLAV